MLDEFTGQQGYASGSRALDAVSAAIRTNGARIPLGVVACLIGAASLTSSWAVAAAGPSACMDLQQAEFATIEELVVTKEKVLAYERDPEGNELALSGKEASFLLADNLKYPVWIETRADELYVQFALPEDDDDHCYNIEFQGQVSVRDGLAHVVPSTVRVGNLDLSRFVAGRPVDASPDDLTGPEAKRLLTQTLHLRVEDDTIHVAVDDPRSLR